MGHQESFLFCDDSEDFTKLCRVLNKAALDDSEDGLKNYSMQIYKVGRLKKDIPDGQNSEVWQQGIYFIWWGGDEYPQTGNWLWDYSEKHFERGFFTSYVSSAKNMPVAEMMSCIADKAPGEIVENDWVRLFCPGKDGQIDLSLIEKL